MVIDQCGLLSLGWERFQEEGDSAEILIIHVLGAVLHYISHPTKDGTAIASPHFKQDDKIVCADITESALTLSPQTRCNPIVAFAAAEVHQTAGRAKRLLLQCHGPRGMAGATMAEPLDEVFTTLLLRS
ncbi:hypothetical protein HY57_13060 [Dyella japonica A8]|uniref:Uncharacterized protein n=1 Tax=Dyella japonica A8 TaxID=1217721 RepID=A0A075K7M6_9GAMM|nr:hypothetical protein HY57_13060 [Dyella japonica A8]